MTSAFTVPKGTKLEIVYANKRTSTFTVRFKPDGGGAQLLVDEAAEGQSGDLIPFLRLTTSGVVEIKTSGTAIGAEVPTARVTLCASPHFMARVVVSGGGDQSAEVRIVVAEVTT